MNTTDYLWLEACLLCRLGRHDQCVSLSDGWCPCIDCPWLYPEERR